MIPRERAGDALFRDPLPKGFSKRVLRLAPGRDLEPERLSGSIVIVEQGELELECRAGMCRRFGRGSMIPIARLPIARLRSVGQTVLVLVAVSRSGATDEFRCAAGSYGDD